MTATADNADLQISRIVPRLLKINEVAEILQVSKTAAYRLVQVGELPAVHIAEKTVRVRLEDLQKYIQEHLVEVI